MGGGSGSGSGSGVERIPTKAAQMQLTFKKNAIKDSKLSKVPSVSSMLAQAAGEYSISQQEKALSEGGYAVAVPGTSFAPQGQAYTQAPGQISDPTVAAAAGLPTASLGKYAVTKSSSEAKGEIAARGLGYVGDVAGVSKTIDIMGIPVTTFTGKTGYSPTGQQVDTADKGGKGGAPTVTATEPEVTPEVTPEVAPDDTMLASSTRRRTRFKRSGAGGTILEGFGALYS